MSGLLQRLADRALGVAPRLRPASQLRPAGDASVEPEAASNPQHAALSDAPAGMAPGLQSPPAAAALQAADAATVLTATTLHPVVRPLPSNGASPRATAARAEAQPIEPADISAQASPRPRQASAALPKTDIDTAAAPTATRTAASDEHALAPQAAQPLASSGSAPVSAPISAPISAPLAASPLSRLSLPARADRDTRAPDVHIHIGRVDVVAGGTPAAPKRERKPAPSAQPLQDYLRQRAGRTPGGPA